MNKGYLFFRLGVEGVGLGSAPLPLQRGRDPLKISPRQLIRERQAEAAEMFVVVRLLWLRQCTGEEEPGHVWALWSIALRSLWNRAWLKHQRVFDDLIEPCGQDAMRPYARAASANTCYRTGPEWLSLEKGRRARGSGYPPGLAGQWSLTPCGRGFRSNTVAKMLWWATNSR